MFDNSSILSKPQTQMPSSGLPNGARAPLNLISPLPSALPSIPREIPNPNKSLIATQQITSTGPTVKPLERSIPQPMSKVAEIKTNLSPIVLAPVIPAPPLTVIPKKVKSLAVPLANPNVAKTKEVVVPKIDQVLPIYLIVGGFENSSEVTIHAMYTGAYIGDNKLKITDLVNSVCEIIKESFMDSNYRANAYQYDTVTQGACGRITGHCINMKRPFIEYKVRVIRSFSDANLPGTGLKLRMGL